MEPITLASLLITSLAIGSLITLMLVWRKERVTVEKLAAELKTAHLAHNTWAERLSKLSDQIQAVQMNQHVSKPNITTAKF